MCNLVNLITDVYKIDTILFAATTVPQLYHSPREKILAFNHIYKTACFTPNFFTFRQKTTIQANFFVFSSHECPNSSEGKSMLFIFQSTDSPVSGSLAFISSAQDG